MLTKDSLRDNKDKELSCLLFKISGKFFVQKSTFLRILMKLILERESVNEYIGKIFPVKLIFSLK